MTVASGMSSAGMLARVRFAVSHPSQPRALLRMEHAALLAAALMAASSAASAQTNSVPRSASNTGYVPTLTYDVASIKVVNDDDDTGGGEGDRNPDREAVFYSSGSSLNELVEEGYGLPYYRISGGPAWAGSADFEIQARSGDSANSVLKNLTASEAKLEKQHMLAALLTDRFQLKVHWETRKLPIYVLVVGKSGPKFQVTRIAAGDRGAPNGVTDFVRQACTPQGCDAQFLGESMEYLSEYLGAMLHYKVLDQTGLTGKYDFTLPGASSTLTAGNEKTTQEASIFTAVQELGLGLVARKGPVEILVIDSAKKPAGN